MKKKWTVEGRCKGSVFIPQSLQQWRRFSWGHGSRMFARAAAKSFSTMFNGSARPSDPIWEFRIR